MSELLTLKELAAFLKVSDRTVYNLIEGNEIPFIRLGDGGDYRFDKIAVVETLANTKK